MYTSGEESFSQEFDMSIAHFVVAPASQLSDIDRLFQEFEGKMKEMVVHLVTGLVNKLRETIEKQVKVLQDKFDNLVQRVASLECSIQAKHTSGQSPQTISDTASCGAQVNSNSEVLRTRVDRVCKAIEEQQRAIEERERYERSKNVIIRGLSECSEVTSEKVEEVQQLFMAKMGLTDVNIVDVRRLGRYQVGRRKPRPVLVCLASRADKIAVMQSKNKLAGTEIFINNDLTKQQVERERELRNIRRHMSTTPAFQNKKISIYKGHIYVDRKLVEESILQECAQIPVNSTTT